MSSEVSFDQMEKALEDESTPYLIVSQANSVKCEKCGADVIEPGRITYYDGVVRKVWCDCIGEAEMQKVVGEFVALRNLLSMSDTENPQ